MHTVEKRNQYPNCFVSHVLLHNW